MRSVELSWRSCNICGNVNLLRCRHRRAWRPIRWVSATAFERGEGYGPPNERLKRTLLPRVPFEESRFSALAYAVRNRSPYVPADGGAARTVERTCDREESIAVMR